MEARSIESSDGLDRINVDRRSSPANSIQAAHSGFEDPMRSYPAVHVVNLEKFDLGTAQTPGSERLAAIAPQLGIETSMWGDLFEVCEVRWGDRGEYAATAKAGDFIQVPAFLPHMEINLSNSKPFRWVVVRSTSTPIVVNLPDDTWP